MTPGEHYTEAERLVAMSHKQAGWAAGAHLVNAAQVHATLALVAATLITTLNGGDGPGTLRGAVWTE